MSLLVAAGATRLRMNLIKYSGKELTATMTATFHAKRPESTNVRSVTPVSGGGVKIENTH